MCRVYPQEGAENVSKSMAGVDAWRAAVLLSLSPSRNKGPWGLSIDD